MFAFILSYRNGLDFISHSHEADLPRQYINIMECPQDVRIFKTLIQNCDELNENIIKFIQN